jgi:hypothetical protein
MLVLGMSQGQPLRQKMVCAPCREELACARLKSMGEDPKPCC